MSSKRSDRGDKGRLPQFVPLLLDTLQTPAWRTMSHGARSLYVALRSRVFIKDSSNNNGRTFLSVRAACAEIGSSHEQVTRWFHELQHFGFIVQTSAGCLGADGHGKAPHWRLTELGTRGGDGKSELPTRDFTKWGGERFRPSPIPPSPKIRIPLRKTAHQRAENRNTTVAENRALTTTERAENRNIEIAPKCAENRHIASNHLHDEQRGDAQPPNGLSAVLPNGERASVVIGKRGDIRIMRPGDRPAGQPGEPLQKLARAAKRNSKRATP